MESDYVTARCNKDRWSTACFQLQLKSEQNDTFTVERDVGLERGTHFQRAQACGAEDKKQLKKMQRLE